MGRSSQARPVREGVPPRARGDRVPVGLPRGTRGVVALRDLLADGVVELQERGELIDEAFDLARAGPEHWEVAPGGVVDALPRVEVGAGQIERGEPLGERGTC